MKNIIYLLFFLFSAKSFAQFSSEHIITTSAVNAMYVHTADLNGDGFNDVIVAASGNKTIAWYENLDGLGNFGARQNINQIFLEYRFVSSADIDGDGDLDILSTALADDLVVWFENLDGLGNFSTKKIINTTLDLPKMAISFDIDLDGDIDIISPSKFDGKITWFENFDGEGNFTIGQTITTIATTPSSVFVVDLDNDGDVDILTDSSSFNNQPAWHENLDGFGNFGPEQIITNDTSGTIWVVASDIDNDGDMDPLTMEFGGGTIAWYANDGFGNFGEKSIITTMVDAPYQIIIADIDNDGNQDVVSVSGADNKIAWYKNDGFGNFGVQQIIALTAINPRSISVADLDGDGYLDVVSASISDNKVAWYKNETYLSINDNTLNTIVLSPNPTNGLLSINAPNSIIVAIEVYDMLGKQIFTSISPANTINLSKLQTGMYLVKIKTEQGSLAKKIIKE